MEIEQLIRSFASPSAAWRGKPFWAWNGELRGEELVRQAHIMKEMGLGGYFMHSRTGLITEYLGEEWFRLINEVADAAEADGMEAWLYDEDRWPSGSAGGKTTADPRFRMKSLYVYESDPDRVEWGEGSFALYAAKLNGIDLYTYTELDIVSVACREDAVRAVEAAVREAADAAKGEPGVWKALRFAVVPDRPSSGYNGATYLDTMSREATARFIELTHEQYARRCGDRLGRSIRGIFTDEPHRGHCFDNREERDGVISCAAAWTDDLFDEFRRRYGFACRPILPELFYRKNGEKVAPVKLFYIDLANALFLERFAAPINEWCVAHGLVLTGHVLHEDSLMNQTVPNGSLMRYYEHMGVPGVDVLTEHNRCYWIVKQLASAARQLGKPWMLSELYGCTGWQFSFKNHKNVGDWQALFGINVRCQHLSWYTMEGEAKRDYPASILHQSPWYGDYKTVEDHFARMGVVLTEGRPDCDVLLLNPIESLWCQAYAGWAKWIGNASPDVEPYEERYRELFHFLTDRQIDFDYGEEEMLSRLASVETENGAPVLRVGKAVYRVAVVANMLTVRPTTLSLLHAFAERGGAVLFCGEVPAYVNAVPSGAPAALAARCVRVPYDGAALAAAVRRYSETSVSVAGADGAPVKDVFAQVRRGFGGDGSAAVVLNTDREAPRRGLTLSLRAPAGSRVEEWNLDTGVRYDASVLAAETGGLFRVRFDLEAGGTRCFVFTRGRKALPPLPRYETVAERTLTGEFSFRCSEPNVCVLDRCRRQLGDGAWSPEDEVLRVDRQLRAELGLAYRGGDMLQPWYANRFDAEEYGALRLSYTFYVETLPASPVYLAGERPELNAYRLNGTALKPGGPNDFWVDVCFNKMEIPAGALKQGFNEVTVDVAFHRTANIEALYLVGDFGVRLEGCRRTLVSAPQRIGCRDYAEYALPFYTGNLTFELAPGSYLPLLEGLSDGADRIVLTPKDFTGACVKVSAAQKTTVLGWEPFEADVTEAVRLALPIFVTVEGTRANVFGPLHETPRPAGACGPGSFLTEGEHWTDGYSLLPSGLRGFVFRAQKRV